MKTRSEIDRQDIWQHKQTKKRYELLEVQDNEARCIDCETKLITYVPKNMLERIQIGFTFTEQRPEPRFKKTNHIPP